MNAEEARKEVCGHPECGMPAAITLRQERSEEEGPHFECYCRQHLDKAVEFAQTLWKVGSPPRAGKWNCSYEKCSEPCVFSYRIIGEGKGEVLSFCHLHLAIAFESLGMLSDLEAA